jgi:hypothetical protein
MRDADPSLLPGCRTGACAIVCMGRAAARRHRIKETDMTAKRARHAVAISDIDAQMGKLLERRKDLLRKRGERIAKLASDAGLAELDIADDRLVEAFRELASRFRGGTTKP